MVGFGRSGDGVNGYTTDASLSIKRGGGNHVNDFGEGTNNSANRDKIWRADFDHPTDANYSFLGTGQLAEDVETTLGSGDSGGPSYHVVNDEPGGVVAINTFGYSVYNTELSPNRWIDPPFFGSGMGGILIHPYLQWINDVMTGSGGGDDGGGGGKPKCHPKRGCTSNVTQLTAEIGPAIDEVQPAGAAIPNGLQSGRLHTSGSFANANTTMDIGLVDSQPEAWAFVAKSNALTDSDRSVRLHRFEPECTVSPDSLFEAWPVSLWAVFDDGLLPL